MATDAELKVDIENLPSDMQALQSLLRRMETEMTELESRLDEVILEDAAAVAFDEFEYTCQQIAPARTIGLLNMLV